MIRFVFVEFAPFATRGASARIISLPRRAPLAGVMLLAMLLLTGSVAPGGNNEAGIGDNATKKKPDVDSALADKLDMGLDNDTQTYPVFVRMRDQLIGGAGEYEKFCRAHAGAKRTELRPKIIQTLRDKADSSWKQVGDAVEELKKTDGVKSLQRYWIVNGFACDATGEACKKLATHDAVSFVYLMTGPLRQHQRPLNPGVVGAQAKEVMRKVLDNWKDDSADPFTTEGIEVPWNLQRIQADAVWNEEKVHGRGVTVALLDSGLMVAPALTAALWKNPREELNGQDDDDNGYVDDLFGYDFQADSYYCLGDSPQLTHGSMCGGIIAGRPINKPKLVTGIAPRARLMMLRGMGYLKAYEYALAHGADVISMSYMWVNVELGNYRGVYRTAHEHLAAAGVVSVGGAGNFSRLPKGHQIALPKDIPCVIAAAGITKDGDKAPASSEGPCTWKGVKFYDDFPDNKPLSKPDVTGLFTGYPMWSRPLKIGAWEIVSDEGQQMALVTGPAGNSFSGPHAAGVAALMFSANLDLCAWQVKELMEQTCKDIGEKGRDYTFGAGLLQALAAVRAAKNVSK